jgi:beta-lactamase regulating signal transducer with metallopeptidase domain
MSGPSELSVAAGVLIDVASKVPLMWGLGWLGARTLASSAAQRHAVWAATLASMPLLAGFSLARPVPPVVDQPWLVALWGAGVLGCSVPMLRGLWWRRRVMATARADGEVPGLWHSDAVDSPLTWGWWRPVVVLPSAAAGWSEAQRRAALAHEEAHVVRHDWAVHQLARVVCALLWFHPFAWWAASRLQLQAELAADDVVVRSGRLRPSEYAQLLLSVARPTGGLALGAAPSALSVRVGHVLGDRSRSPHRGAVLATTLLGALLCGACTRAWSALPVPDAPVTCLPDPHHEPGLLP